MAVRTGVSGGVGADVAVGVGGGGGGGIRVLQRKAMASIMCGCEVAW